MRACVRVCIDQHQSDIHFLQLVNTSSLLFETDMSRLYFHIYQLNVYRAVAVAQWIERTLTSVRVVFSYVHIAAVRAIDRLIISHNYYFLLGVTFYTRQNIIKKIMLHRIRFFINAHCYDYHNNIFFRYTDHIYF